MDPEMKKLFDQLRTSIAEFQSENDKRIKALESKGTVDPLTDQKVKAMSDNLSTLDGKVAEALAAAKNAETIANRQPGLGTDPADEKKKAAAARTFYAISRRIAPDAVNLDTAAIEAFDRYRAAFRQMLRVGPDGLTPEYRNALTIGGDPSGGYWVEPDESGRMVQLIYETSPMRQLADVQTIGTDALEGSNDLQEADAGWVGETEARNTTTAPFTGEWRIPVFELYAKPKASQNLLDDAMIDVEAWLQGKVAAKMGRKESTAYVAGTGSKQPRGFLTYPSGTPDATAAGWKVIERVLSGQASGFKASGPADCLVNMETALKAQYRANATWTMSRATQGLVNLLKDGQGNYLLRRDFAAGGIPTVLGYPVVQMADMPAAASGSLSIALGDFKAGYQIVDRQGIRLLRDPFTDKPWVVFYTTRRTGGDVVNFEAIKLLQFSA